MMNLNLFKNNIKRYEIYYQMINNTINHEKVLFKTNFYFLAKISFVFYSKIYIDFIKSKHIGLYCYDYKKHDFIIQYSCFFIQ